ncbi:PadR family transcriptional regulator [Streptomyces sp. NPDC059218]|uniref:PadR family transcriptional regulator n=1 Tax=unclassified Streptomyces TaxID=2593676 RepID=UPI003678026F
MPGRSRRRRVPARSPIPRCTPPPVPLRRIEIHRFDVLLDRRAEPGASAAQRHTLSLTTTGRAELLRRLRGADGLEISDGTRYFTVLAFLSQLPDTADQHAVLRRRLEFLEQPASFFHDGDVPLGVEDTGDPYRRDMLTIARATSRAERAWLREVLA